MTINQYPLKHVRLQQLEEAGFNVADFIAFPPRQLNLTKLRAFFDKHGRISCRHFHEDEKRFFKCPVRYEMDNFDEIAAFCQEHNELFWTLCNQAIPLQDSIFAGNVLLLDEITSVVEYFEGTGTPRDIEHKSTAEIKIRRVEFGKPLPEDIPPALAEVARKFRRFLPDQRPITLEFSIYPYPIGKFQRHDIFWEWRLGWLHHHMEIFEALIAENEELKATIRTLRMLASEEEKDRLPGIHR